MAKDDDVPVELARLWRLTAASRRGRPAVLDVGRVVAAAVELADQEGLVGVTLPKVAARLQVTTMSLYRHVGSKAELLELMRDHAGGAAPASAPPPDWRSGLYDWASAQRERFQVHPWLAELPISGPPAGPNAVSWMESCLVALRDTGLSPLAKLGVLNLIGGFVRNAALLQQQLAAGREDGVDQARAQQAYGRSLARLVDSDTFPEVAALFSSSPFAAMEGTGPGAGRSGGADPDFDFGLDIILGGIEGLIRRAELSRR